MLWCTIPRRAAACGTTPSREKCRRAAWVTHARPRLSREGRRMYDTAATKHTTIVDALDDCTGFRREQRSREGVRCSGLPGSIHSLLVRATHRHDITSTLQPQLRPGH